MTTTSEAELLLRDGRYLEGRALLSATLDDNPAHLKALDVLGSLAEVSHAHEDELFARLQAALAGARETGLQHRLRGRQLSYALFFGREALTQKMVANLDDYVMGDDKRRVEMGALLIELGRARQGERLLRAATTPLAKYHLALATANRQRAWELLDALRIPQGGELLGRIGIAFLELEQKRSDGARALLKEVPSGEARSELMLLRVCAYLVESRHADARLAAYDLANPPYHADPSTLHRAASLLGLSSLSKLSQHVA